MATKYENYVTGDTSEYYFHSTSWMAQTFTPSISHIITSVVLLLFRAPGTSPGIITARIRATDGDGLPTGSNLAIGTTNGNNLAEGAPYTWREITLGAGTLLVAGTKYAIIIGAAVDSAGQWRVDGSGGYGGGAVAVTYDSGASWAHISGADFMFEEWGDETGFPTVTTQAVTSIAATTATGNGNITDLGDTTVTEHGHCWSTTNTPTTSDSKTTNGTAATTGAFTSNLTGLTTNTLYYVRAYAYNSGGTSYGGEVNFTAGAPSGGELAGLYAVVEERFHYVDAYGVERYVLGEIV